MLRDNVTIAAQWREYANLYERIRKTDFPPTYREQATDFRRPGFSSADSLPLNAPPGWESLAPLAPGWITTLFGGQKRYDRAVVDAKRSAEELNRKYQLAESRRQESLRRQHLEHEIHCKDLESRHREATRELLRVDEAMAAADQTAIEEHFSRLIGALDGPFGKFTVSAVRYKPRSRRLIVDIELPGWAKLEGPKEHKFIKSRNEFTTVMRSEREVSAAYRDIIAGMVLGTLHTVFAGDRYNHIDSAIVHAEMVFSEVRPDLVGSAIFASVGTSRAHFSSLDRTHATIALLGLEGKTSARIRSLTSVKKLDDESVLP